MRIVIKSYSVMILILGVFILGSGSYAIYQAENFSKLLQFGVYVAQDSGPLEYDAGNWKFHWIIIWTYLCSIGLIGIIGGLGAFFLKKWAANLLLILVTSNLLVDFTLYFGNIYKYAFEKIETYDLFISAGLAVLTWTIFTRSSSQKILLKI